MLPAIPTQKPTAAQAPRAARPPQPPIGSRGRRRSHHRRGAVGVALRQGGYYPWDFQPLQKASERFMRNHMDLNVLEEAQRFPRGE